MALTDLLFKGTIGAVVGAGRILGSTPGRIVAGGVLGAAYNVATSPYESSQNLIESAARGAAAGVGIGLGTSYGLFKMKQFGRAAMRPETWARGIKAGIKSIPGIGVGAYKLGRGTAKAAAWGINTLARHPGAALGLGATAGVLAMSSSTLTDITSRAIAGYPGLTTDRSLMGNLATTEYVQAATEEESAAQSLQMGSLLPSGRISSSRAAFMNSTSGLVFGLHSGRHR